MNEELKVIITAKIAPLQSELKKVSKSLDGVSKNTAQMTSSMDKSFKKSIGSISKLKVAIGAMVYAAVKVGKSIGAMGAEAISVDNQVKSLSRTMGSSAGEFANWAATTAAQFGISEKAAVEFGGQFSSIISRTEKSGEAVKDLTQDFLKLGATIAGNTKFDVDDVMGRLRSGLSGRNEAIEDLGIEVKPETIKGTLAYTQAVGRMGVEWDKMTAKQQSQVRMQAILEQGNQRFGNGLTGVAQQMAIFKASVENVKLAWGRAFAPIVQFVIPVLQNLVGWLTVAATYVGAFLGLFFKVEGSVASANKQAAGFADSMSDAATGSGNISSGLDNANKSAKKLQRTLFGFDVIHNVAESQDSSASGGGGSGGGIGSVNTSGFKPDKDGVAAFDELNKKIEEATSKIKSFGGKVKKIFGSFIPLIAGVAAGFGLIKIVDLISDGNGVVNVIDDILKKLPVIGNHPAMKSFRNGVTSLLGPIDSVVAAVVDLGAKIGTALGFEGLSATIVGFAAIAAVIAIVVAALVSFYQKSEEFRNIVSTAIQGVIDIFISLWEGTIKPIFEMIIGIAKVVWEQGIKPLWDSFADFIGAIATLLLNIWNSVLQPLVKWFVDVFGPIIAVAIGVVAAVFGGLLIAASAIFGAILDILTGLINWVAGFFAGTWKDVMDRIVGFFSVAWDVIKLVISTALDVIMAVIKFVWENIVTYIQIVLEFLLNMIKGIWNHIASIITAAMEFIKLLISTAWDLIKLVISTVMEGIWKNITTVWETIKGVFTGVIDFVKNVFTGNWRGAWDAVIGIFRNLFGFIPKIFGNAWDAVMKLFSGGGKIFKGFAESVADIFKKLVNSLIRGINTVIGAPFKALNKSFDKFRKISILGAKPFSWLPSIGIPAIPQFATGGFPEDGLFHANSRELVGKFSNGKTAVANNDQIISGVSTGVANAVRQVLLNTDKNGSQPINLTVQIGSNQIAKEVINAIDDYTMKTGMTFKTI